MWQKVSALSEIQEGGSKVVTAGGKEVALFKFEGKIYALDNTCPHQGGPLGEGYLDGSRVTCPWHAWAFDVKTGDCQTVSGVKQPGYAVKMDGQDILLNL